MTKSKLFLNAWSIARDAAAKFGGSVKSYFAEALKMAHKGIELTVESLIKIGGNEWVKGDYHRVYFNAATMIKFIGLSYSTYKTGNISSATLNGNHISNGKAASIRNGLAACKFWFDAKKGEFDSRDMSSDLFETVVNSIKR
ncbi:hypothetical protein [Pantoea sp. BAV 3049]|uniref:hypothetical protein n=1 Tax=Pantoea sp. BAV 3049 TaxID=2654188 RepID=UPI00131CABF5|nr:hypothetical protein [Pantoea sp. BAV 3049]